MGWGAGNIGGGSGGGLNFKVVGNPQPANPKENTIWLNTDVDITGHYLQAEQPAEMAEGEVWISTGTASQVAFNAAKKGTVMVYPISAKQYVSGAWVDKTAKIYQNGEWVDWINYLYNAGTEYVSFETLNGAVEKTASSIKLTANDNGTATICTGNAVDLKDKKSVFVDISKMVSGSSFTFHEVAIMVSATKSTSNPIARKNDTEKTTGIFELDISDINEKCYIIVQFYQTSNSGYTGNIEVTKIVLE